MNPSPLRIPDQGHPLADPHLFPAFTKLFYSLLPSHVADSSKARETLPLFRETLPVRGESGHFAGFSGIDRIRKTAELSEGVRLLEWCSTLISFSDVKTILRKPKPCRF